MQSNLSLFLVLLAPKKRTPGPILPQATAAAYIPADCIIQTGWLRSFLEKALCLQTRGQVTSAQPLEKRQLDLRLLAHRGGEAKLRSALHLERI